MQELIAFETKDIRICFSRKDGTIQSAIRNGHELATPSANPFTIQLLDRDGNAVRLNGKDFASCKCSNSGFSYTGCSQFPELAVEIRIRIRGQFVAFSNAVAGVPENYVLEWIDAPQLFLPTAEHKLFQPMHDGVIIEDPNRRQKYASNKYHPIEFSKRGQAFGPMYPGRCMMQYMAHYDGNGGIFMAAFDEQSIPKAMDYEPMGETLRLSMQTFTGCGFGSGYSTPFEYVITGFDGDWMAAAEIYRQWYDSYAPSPNPLPSWLERSPVTVVYPVLGVGLDHGKHELHPNCYYPYSSALPYLRNFNKLFDSSVLALLMHWEGTAPWAPPYVWPPLGGEDLLAQFRDELHKDGNLLGLYCSGTAWTQTSSINDYSQEQKCKDEGLERFMLRGPKGEIDAAVCNGLNSQRLGYDMCMCEGWSREQVKAEVMKLAAFGVDYCQYFDQNHGGGQHICYSQKHHHAPVPGPAQTESMRLLMHELHDSIASIGSEMAMGCESSAAEPFVNELQLNDARASFLWWVGTPVPAQSYVFHGRTLCFGGNQCGVSWALKWNECPENLLFRIAYGFNAGDLLAVTLKEEGKIHWCWALLWDNPEPEQESIITLVRNLNAIRRKYPQYLLHGRMEQPTIPLKCGTWTLRCAERDVTLPSVFDSSWSAADGSRIRIITNFLTVDQTVTVGDKSLAIPALSAAVLKE